jgi:hypothetical protein
LDSTRIVQFLSRWSYPMAQGILQCENQRYLREYAKSESHDKRK